MRVLVIGGSGLMGGATVRLLQMSGHTVTNLSRGGQVTLTGGHPRVPLPEGITTLLCDRTTEGPKLQQILREGKFEAIIDYFAMVPAHVEDVIAGSDRAALKNYIFISTNMVYPGGPGGFDISPLRPTVSEGSADVSGADSAPDDYGGLKLKCEAVLRRAFATDGFPYTTVRPPSVIGPACDQRHELLQRVAMGLPVPDARERPLAANPAGGFRLAYSEDIADMCVRILDTATPSSVVGEAFNAACEETVTLEQYVAAIRDNAPADVTAAWPPHELAAEALASHGAKLRSYEAQSCLDITKAQQVLGWTPTPFSEVLRETVAWHIPLLQGPSL
eukprot:COSAG05_NODE_1437_length_4887_cov_5.343150_4_plen_333_part_00